MILILGGFLGGLYCLFKYTPLLYANFLNRYGTDRAHGVLALVVIAGGFIAYGVKRADQSMYGRIEIIFGSASAMVIVTSMKSVYPELPQWASLVGCAYVIVRGLDNWRLEELRKKRNYKKGLAKSST